MAMVAAVANAHVGSYAVVASLSGLSNTVNFQLDNVLGQPSFIQTTGGGNQNVLVNAIYPVPLKVLVSDEGSNRMEGQTVNFSCPTTGILHAKQL